MGCIFSKKSGTAKKELEQGLKQSFKRNSHQRLTTEDYKISHIQGGEVVKAPGSVNGEQLIIENCTNASIYVLDFSGTVIVDDCTACTIVLGVVQNSIYLRNSSECNCIISCGQFRARDCRKCLIFIHSETQPIIESSTRIKFGTFGLSYKGLLEQQQLVGLNPGIISWTDVYDFTPITGETHWSFIESEKRFTLKTLSVETYKSLNDIELEFFNKKPVLVSIESTV